MNTEKSYSKKQAAAFGCGQISSQGAYQAFTLLVFTFYFTIVGINILYITIGFIIWSFWNMVNDPLMGYISDRTHSKWGRRRPYMIIALIPLAIIMLLLFTPPIVLGIHDETLNFIYFICIIIIFELFFTMWDLNLTSMFPEVFITIEERTEANNIRQVILIVGLLFAFILPGLIIPDATKAEYLPQFFMYGIIMGIIVILGGLIVLRFGPREKAEFKDEYKNIPSFFTSLKYCVKSKSFRWYIPAEIANWFVFGMLAILVILYGKFVLGIQDTLMQALLLGVAFISAVIFITVLWNPLVRKIGPRKSWMISMSIWAITFIPLFFIQYMIAGMIVFFLMGIGLSGSLYIIDLIISDIVDEDELNTGVRREAAYYGINGFFLRISTVFVFIAIGLVFTYSGWAVYEPESVTPDVILGLRILMAVFPAIALLIAIIVIYKYPLDGERLRQVKEDLQKLHAEKKSKI
jgi:GPH family glycoside/pentoside/hexuronide:cation symporter